MKRSDLLTAATVIMCLLPAVVHAATWHVDEGVCPAGGSGLLDDPFCLIQDGIDAARDGDTILVAAGYYRGAGNMALDLGGKAIALVSTGGAQACTIDAAGTGRVFNVHRNEGPSTTVTGFTITGGSAAEGGALYFRNGGPMFVGCIVEQSEASEHGGGIYCAFGAHPTFVNCLIRGNTAPHGSAAYLANPSALTLINCTITGNKAALGTLAGDPGTAATITNSILWHNEPPINTTYAATIRFSNVEGGYPGEGNVDVDPMFMELADGALGLRSGSPCIDAGASSAVPAGATTDLSGSPRFYDDPCAPDTGLGVSPIVDMGAIEFAPPASCGDGTCDQAETCLTCSCDCGVCCGDGTCNAYEDSRTCPIDCPYQTLRVPEDHATIQAAIDSAEDEDVIVVAPGTYHEAINFAGKAIILQSAGGPAVTTIDASGLGATAVAFDTYETHRTVLDGFTITGASGAIAGGIMCDQSSPTIRNCVIRGNDGLYAGGIYIRHDSHPHIHTCTITESTSEYGAPIRCRDGSDPLLFGCLITENGETFRTGAIDAFDGSSPLIIKCRMTANLGTSIVEFSDAPHAAIIDCTIADHVEARGIVSHTSNVCVHGCVIQQNGAGGIACAGTGQALIANCLLTGNGIRAGCGGAVNFDGGVEGTIVNCTMVGNHAVHGGAVYVNLHTTATITNSILWANSWWQVYLSSLGAANVTYCCVQDGYEGEGNFDADPGFASLGVWDDRGAVGSITDHVLVGGNYRLLAGSPCIDRANGTWLPILGPLDVDGRQRDVDDPYTPDLGIGTPSFVDIGAFEYQPACGDGVLDPLEDCDDGNTSSDDGCSQHCSLEYCGDGVWQPGLGEECDDGNVNDGDACTADCLLPRAIRYVDDDAPPGGDGTSWQTAFRHLRDALTAAAPEDEIRIAGGIYRPDQTDCGESLLGDRRVTFNLASGMTVRGGYAGLAQADDPNRRDIGLYVTLLSGDLGENDVEDRAGFFRCYSGEEPCVPECIRFDTNGDGDVDKADGGLADNSRHVVSCTYNDKRVLLEGVTISGGFNEGAGAGLYVRNADIDVFHTVLTGNLASCGAGVDDTSQGDLRLTNCQVTSNCATDGGGGLRHSGGTLTMVNCDVIGNRAVQDDGGGIDRSSGAVLLANCVIAENVSAGRGGGIALDHLTDESTLADCTIVDNGSSSSGGGVSIEYDIPLHITNSIIWGNRAQDTGDQIDAPAGGILASHSCIEAGFSGEGNVDVAPLLVRHAHWDDNGTPGDPADDIWVNGDHHLQPSSPCISRGDEASRPPDVVDLDGDGDDIEPLPLDRDGVARVLCSEVDMGAYEFGIGDHNCDQTVDLVDFTGWQTCTDGPGGAYAADACAAFDFDSDGDIDLADLAGFQRTCGQ